MKLPYYNWDIDTMKPSNTHGELYTICMQQNYVELAKKGPRISDFALLQENYV